MRKIEKSSFFRKKFNLQIFQLTSLTFVSFIQNKIRNKKDFFLQRKWRGVSLTEKDNDLGYYGELEV